MEESLLSHWQPRPVQTALLLLKTQTAPGRLPISISRLSKITHIPAQSERKKKFALNLLEALTPEP